VPRRKEPPRFAAGDRVEFWSHDRDGCWKPGVVLSTPAYCTGEIEIGVGGGMRIRRAAGRCRLMDLPIDVVPGTTPPRFRWHFVVDTPVGKRCTQQEGSLPPVVEKAVADLIKLAKKLATECEALKKDVVYLNRQLEEVKHLREPQQQPAPQPKRAK
jgi:hypothetical protein